MSKSCLLMMLGMVGLFGCGGTPCDPEPVRPVGDSGGPEEEFRLAHLTATQLSHHLDELRAAAGPGVNLASRFPESVELSKALSAALRVAGRLGCEVGLADPTGPLGSDALYDCLLYSTESATRLRTALALAVRHHPHDPRLGEYLYSALGNGIPQDADTWMSPALDRVLATTNHPAVRAAAQTSRGRLLLQSPDPDEVAIGERLLAEVVQFHPDEMVGQTRVAAWAGGLLAAHQKVPGGGALPTVLLAP